MGYEHPLRPSGWYTRPEMIVILGNLLSKRPDTRLRTFLETMPHDPTTVRAIGVGKKIFNVYAPEIMFAFAEGCVRAGEISQKQLESFKKRHRVHVCV